MRKLILVGVLALGGCIARDTGSSEPIVLPGCSVEYTSRPQDAGVPPVDAAVKTDWHPGPVGEPLPYSAGTDPEEEPESAPSPAEDSKPAPAPEPTPAPVPAPPVCDLDVELGDPEPGAYLGQMATMRYDKRALRFAGANTANDVAMATWVVLDVWSKSTFYDAAREADIRAWLANPVSVVVDTNILHESYPTTGRGLVGGLTSDGVRVCADASGHAHMAGDFTSLSGDVVVHELMHGLERKLFDDWGGDHARDGVWRGPGSLLTLAKTQFATLRGKRDVRLYPDLARSINAAGDLDNPYLFESGYASLAADYVKYGGSVEVNLNVIYALNLKRYARSMSLGLYEDAFDQIGFNRRATVTIGWWRDGKLSEDALLRMKCSLNEFQRSISNPLDLAALDEAAGACPSPMPVRTCPAGVEDFSRACSVAPSGDGF